MTTPHHSEPAREAVALDESKVTTAMIDAAFKVCPLDAAAELGNRSDAAHDRRRNLRLPAPATSGGLEAVTLRKALERIKDTADNGFVPREGIEARIAWIEAELADEPNRLCTAQATKNPAGTAMRLLT